MAEEHLGLHPKLPPRIEWRWTGTQQDGNPFEWRGVTLFGIREGQIAWARLYMEPVEREGADITETVRGMAEGSSPA